MDNFYNVIGLMSGTSLDGLDIAYCQFSKNSKNWNFKLLIAETLPYNEEWKNKLKNADKLNAVDLLLLNNEFGYYLGEKSIEFIINHNLQVDFISSHGHTVFHQPEKRLTYQIGNGDCISAVSKLAVICDFRTHDVALGGQGAPLVPIGDKLLFSEFDYCINLGGIANISFDNDDNMRIAYDICPYNIVLNYLSGLLGYDFDDAGRIAASGLIDNDLLNNLENLDYYKKSYPKSLGKEWIEANVFPLIINSEIRIEDKLKTFAEHIVYRLSKSIMAETPKNVLITGGGAYNTYLINRLREVSSNMIVVPDENLINFKEALIFAFLGVLKYHSQCNCLQSVTGAVKDSIVGKFISY